MKAFIFDVDGVIAETPHEQAWKDACIEWKIIDKGFNFTPFYAKFVAGEPGVTGALNILEGLGESYFQRYRIPKDEKLLVATEFRTRVKQRILESYIERGEVKIYNDILRIIKALRKEGYPTMAVSSSENAMSILQKFNLLEHFSLTALGTETHWKRKIDKANHYAMAYGKLLHHVNDFSAEVFVFEDAPKGIAAVANLGFFPIGISRISKTGMRLASKDDLIAAGARLAFNEKELKAVKLEEVLGWSH